MAERELPEREQSAAALYEATAQPWRFRDDPRRADEITVTLDVGNRAAIMEALEFWHNNGPRSRNCREAQLAMLRVQMAIDASRQPAIDAGPDWTPPPSVDEQLAATGTLMPEGQRFIDAEIIDAEIVEDP